MKRILTALGLMLASAIAIAALLDPPVVKEPGTQPGEVGSLESPNKCDNCHGGYNSAVEPAHNWRGGMMAHAGRDPIMWATMAVAEQDFDGSGDLCLRCHAPAGWLGGRSTPTDGSALTAGDADGVECDYCHKLTNPDNSEHLGVQNFPFIANMVDGQGNVHGYYGSGMSSIWGGADKLGPYSDADARHQFMQSEFHRSEDFCGTCHDVSNPVVGNLAHNYGALVQNVGTVEADGAIDGAVDSKAAFNNFPYQYGIVERTYSEYRAGQISKTLVSQYGNLPTELKGGALKEIHTAATAAGGNGDYADGTPRYYTCQSCHMRPVTGYGANKRGIPLRTDLPLHDMTGGNYWMPAAIQYLDAQGKLRLGGGLTTELITALNDGTLRSKEQLALAATLVVSGDTLRVVNHTGHKLISGYPEGRRMWLHTTWYSDSEVVLREDGQYGILKDENNNAVTVNDPASGAPVEVRSILNLEDPNSRIYEAHMGMTQEWASKLIAPPEELGFGYSPYLVLAYDRVTGDVEETLGGLAGKAPGSAEETYHFVLNNTIVADNRIPPYGLEYAEARKRNVLPVPATQYGVESEPPPDGSVYNYYDEIILNPPTDASYATIELLYQPTSWEYVQFLYKANGNGNAFLAGTGDDLLEAWLNTGMAEPEVMATATWGSAPPVSCAATTPTLQSAVPGNQEVTVSWSAASGAAGYRLYYDQADKAQLVADTGSETGYLDTGLSNGDEYCYMVTAYTDGDGNGLFDPASDCESAFSEVLCAVPSDAGHSAVLTLPASPVSGTLSVSGKGKNKTTEFVPSNVFQAGDAVVLRIKVQDGGDLPIAGAVVTYAINGPDGSIEVSSSQSDTNGVADATWQTTGPNHKGAGGTTTGSYIANVTGVKASGYTWDAGPQSTTFTIE